MAIDRKENFLKFGYFGDYPTIGSIASWLIHEQEVFEESLFYAEGLYETDSKGAVEIENPKSLTESTKGENKK